MNMNMNKQYREGGHDAHIRGEGQGSNHLGNAVKHLNDGKEDFRSRGGRHQPSERNERGESCE